MKRVYLTPPPPPIQKPPELMVDVSTSGVETGQGIARKRTLFVTLGFRFNGEMQQQYRIEAKAAIALAKTILDEANRGCR